mmetsp:Transcript_38751/g.71069  ORF Transcript_38751/g.71069 Transcript_38751/m.71069 type:complete len:228 (-) Transcript_38751:1785-2468(-)
MPSGQAYHAIISNLNSLCILHCLRTSKSLWRKRRRTTLTARPIHVPKLIRHPHHKRLLLHKQRFNVSIQLQVKVILMRQQIPCRVSLRYRFLIGRVGVGTPRHETLATCLLIGWVHVICPPKEFLKACHRRLDLGHQSHQELRPDDLHGLLQILIRQFPSQLIRQLSCHPIILHNVRGSILFQRPLLKLRLISRFPIRHTNVVKHAYGSINRMAKHRKKTSFRRLRE